MSLVDICIKSLASLGEKWFVEEEDKIPNVVILLARSGSEEKFRGWFTAERRP